MITRRIFVTSNMRIDSRKIVRKINKGIMRNRRVYQQGHILKKLPEYFIAA